VSYSRVRVMSKGEPVEQFASSMHLVLDLVDKYPHDSLVTHILDCVGKLCNTSSVSNLCFARRKSDTNVSVSIITLNGILPKTVTDQTVFDVTQNIIQTTPTLVHLSGDILLVSSV
jgi:hypothetical protein